MISGHIEFDGPTRTMKLYLIDGATKELRHTIQAHGDAVGDPGYPDRFGHLCKCPPGDYYLGEPQSCGARDPITKLVAWSAANDDEAYGCWFTPLLDGFGYLQRHGRAGNGVHGGGTADADPFALMQPWQPTEGCIRLYNQDNEQIFVPFVRDVRSKAANPDTAVRFTVIW